MDKEKGNNNYNTFRHHTIFLPDELLKHWRYLTDNNEHHKVRIEIAKYFGFSWFEHFFYGVSFVSNTIHKLSTELRDKYCEMTNLMLETIKVYYGVEVYYMIHSCL